MESYLTKDDIIQSLVMQLALKPSDGDNIEAIVEVFISPVGPVNNFV